MVLLLAFVDDSLLFPFHLIESREVVGCCSTPGKVGLLQQGADLKIIQHHQPSSTQESGDSSKAATEGRQLPACNCGTLRDVDRESQFVAISDPKDLYLSLGLQRRSH